METSSISAIKKELSEIPQKQLIELCLSLGKYKKDNKEYLDYLLFHAHDKLNFAQQLKTEIDDLFLELTFDINLYYAKKKLRKILRIITKYSKYINDKATTADLLIYFCLKIKQSKIPYQKSQLLINLYDQQLKKIDTLILGLHEDVRQDYIPQQNSIR
jgi:hypothetical protein